MKQTALCLLTAIICWTPQSALTQEAVEQLANKMPPGANAVMLANIANIRDSQIARSEKWFNSQSAMIESGIGFLPQGTDVVIFASQIDFASFTPSWTSGYMTFQQAPTLVQVSRQVNGTMDAVAGQDVVHAASDLFVFRQSNQTLGTYSPANRQNFANWMTKLSTGSDNPLGRYLMNSVVSPGHKSDFSMAFNVANVVSSSNVYQQAKDSDALNRAKINPRRFADLMASIQGVTISVAFDSGIDAKVAIEFGKDAALVAPVAKQLLIEFVDNHGAHVDELASWSAKVEGNRISTGGSLSKKSLRRLISLFDTPEPHMAASQSTVRTADTASASPSPGEATKHYFDAVKSMLSELEKDIGQASLSTYLYQKWLKSYAEEIDNLSMHGVDSDMLDFGAWVAQSFRQISLRVTDSHQNTSVRNKNLMASNANAAPYRYGGYPYGYGYYPRRLNQTATQADRMANNQQARSKSINFGADLFTQIRDHEAQVRRLMTQRYPDQF